MAEVACALLLPCSRPPVCSYVETAAACCFITVTWCCVENGKWEGSNFFNDGNCYLNLFRAYNRSGGGGGNNQWKL